jgi:tetratricopeptide (TPR) repeat protein
LHGAATPQGEDLIADDPIPCNFDIPSDAVNESLIALRHEGLERLKDGAFAEAIELLGRARALDPGDARCQIGLGVALQRAGRHKEALEPLERARNSFPEDPAPLVHASLSLLALGKAELSLQAASEACALAPRLPQAHLAHGQALMALDQPARAEQAFTTALQYAPKWTDILILRGAAQTRSAVIAEAKRAMDEARRFAPDHAKAKASTDRPMAGGKPILTAWRPTSPAASVGLAVEYLSRKPAFARLPFGDWSQVLFHQVARGHYLFVVNQDRKICGFLGWALTDECFAELWLEGRSALTNDQCLDGDCVIVNAWSADTTNVNRFILEAMFKLFAERRAIYFKRHYPDGRERPVRLTVPAHRDASAGKRR